MSKLCFYKSFPFVYHNRWFGTISYCHFNAGTPLVVPFKMKSSTIHHGHCRSFWRSIDCLWCWPVRTSSSPCFRRLPNLSQDPEHQRFPVHYWWGGIHLCDVHFGLEINQIFWVGPFHDHSPSVGWPHLQAHWIIPQLSYQSCGQDGLRWRRSHRRPLGLKNSFGS